MLQQKDKLKLIEGFEELSLKALQSDGRDVYAPRVERLSLTATMMPKVEDCTRLGPVPLPDRELDWDLTNAAEETAAIPVATVRKVKDIRPVFGVVLDGLGSRSDICNVYFSQRTIYFDTGSYKIGTASAEQELKAIQDNLVKYPDSTVVVEAHADEPGGRNINLALGARRASSVGQYLSQAIAVPRLQLLSLGANCPQRQGLGNIHVRENRRATIKIIPKTNLNQ
jgi:outer membrane protein OmpA-like peptidoglycan-associated protein